MTKIKKTLKKFILTNSELKIISLVIAIISWMVIVSEQSIDATFKYDVEIIKSQKLVITNDIPKTILITVHGLRSDIKYLETTNFVIVIDLKKMKAGNTMYKILPEKINISKNVSIVSINPESLLINLDDVITKEVRLKPSFIGKPREDYYILDYKITPENILVKGSKKELVNLHEINLIPVNLENKTDSFRTRTYLDLETKNIWENSATDIWLEVNIAKRK
jgi:YbbR domain-containing protein